MAPDIKPVKPDPGADLKNTNADPKNTPKIREVKENKALRNEVKKGFRIIPVSAQQQAVSLLAEGYYKANNPYHDKKGVLKETLEVDDVPFKDLPTLKAFLCAWRLGQDYAQFSTPQPAAKKRKSSTASSPLTTSSPQTTSSPLATSSSPISSSSQASSAGTSASSVADVQQLQQIVTSQYQQTKAELERLQGHFQAVQAQNQALEQRQDQTKKLEETTRALEETRAGLQHKRDEVARLIQAKDSAVVNNVQLQRELQETKKLLSQWEDFAGKQIAKKKKTA